MKHVIIHGLHAIARITLSCKFRLFTLGLVIVQNRLRPGYAAHWRVISSAPFVYYLLFTRMRELLLHVWVATCVPLSYTFPRPRNSWFFQINGLDISVLQSCPQIMTPSRNIFGGLGSMQSSLYSSNRAKKSAFKNCIIGRVIQKNCKLKQLKRTAPNSNEDVIQKLNWTQSAMKKEQN